jgi:hypothetical protein
LSLSVPCPIHFFNFFFRYFSFPCVAKQWISIRPP